MRSLFLTVICTFFLMVNSRAQEDYNQQDTVDVLLHNMAPDATEPEGDTTLQDITGDTTLYIHNLPFHSDTIRFWKKSKDYAYMADIDSFLHASQKVPDKPDTGQGRSFMDKLLGSSFIKVIFWILAAGFVLFILYRLFLSKGIFVRDSTPAVVSVPDDLAKADMEADLEAGLANALANNDYRLAVRYHFLQVLKQLSDKDELQYAPEKTNYAYVQEVSPGKRQAFSKLVLHYEFTWYGHVPVTAELYRRLENEFKLFKS